MTAADPRVTLTRLLDAYEKNSPTSLPWKVDPRTHELSNADGPHIRYDSPEADSYYSTSVATHVWPRNVELIVTAVNALPVLAAALQAVLDLHRSRHFVMGKDFVGFNQTKFPDQCDHCRSDWPCRTYVAVAESLSGLNPTEEP